jgi:hypothetical protein
MQHISGGTVVNTMEVREWRMSVVTDRIGKSFGYGRGRRVSIRRDDKDFVVAFQPEDHVVFRHTDASALRDVCRKLRWEIVDDKSVPNNLTDIRAYLSGLE